MRKLSLVVVCLWAISVAAAQTKPPVPGEAAPAVAPDKPALALSEPEHGGIHWKPLIREWWLWVATENVERIVKEPKTRDQLSGPFFRDWFDSVAMYHFDNWNDGGKVVTSYVAHPTQGAIAEALYWQNDDHVRFSEQDFHSTAYRHALLQAFAFATVDAVLWKVGPLSEASIGNVGLPVQWWEKDCKQLHTCVDRTGVSDMVMNEVGGTAMTIGYQWLDKHLQKRIESGTQSRALIDATRMLTNPPQTVANVMRFRRPWYRDNRQ